METKFIQNVWQIMETLRGASQLEEALSGALDIMREASGSDKGTIWIKETKAYLSRESVLTTVAGLVLGVLVGAVLTPLAIKTIQQPDTEFIKSFSVIAGSIAVSVEALFSIVINSLVFRKVKDLNLRDIA